MSADGTEPGAVRLERYEELRALLRRVEDDQPVHYFDCERFNVTDYGTRQGKCDCTATKDVNVLVDAVRGVLDWMEPGAQNASFNGYDATRMFTEVGILTALESGVTDGT